MPHLIQSRRLGHASTLGGIRVQQPGQCFYKGVPILRRHRNRTTPTPTTRPTYRPCTATNPNGAANEFADRMRNNVHQTQDHLLYAQDRQAEYYIRGHSTTEFNIGDQVLVEVPELDADDNILPYGKANETLTPHGNQEGTLWIMERSRLKRSSTMK